MTRRNKEKEYWETRGIDTQLYSVQCRHSKCHKIYTNMISGEKESKSA